MLVIYTAVAPRRGKGPTIQAAIKNRREGLSKQSLAGVHWFQSVGIEGSLGAIAACAAAADWIARHRQPLSIRGIADATLQAVAYAAGDWKPWPVKPMNKRNGITATADLFSTDHPVNTAKDRPLRIRAGIGGWTYAPWRGGMFYPAGLVQRRELEYASRQLTAIEINGTYYGTQKPATYAKWRDETPDDFLFSAKAPQRIMESRALSKSGHQIEDFIGGIVELGDKLGPLVWQFDKGRRIDAGEFAAFVELLPREHAGRRLRHVLDVRDPGFIDARYLALARKHGMATVFTDSTEYPSFADLTADFVYARLMRSQARIATGYAAADLDAWSKRASLWAEGGDPVELPHVEAPTPMASPRDVFVYFISSAKERNPAAAMALLQRLGAST